MAQRIMRIRRRSHLSPLVISHFFEFDDRLGKKDGLYHGGLLCWSEPQEFTTAKLALAEADLQPLSPESEAQAQFLLLREQTKSPVPFEAIEMVEAGRVFFESGVRLGARAAHFGLGLQAPNVYHYADDTKLWEAISLANRQHWGDEAKDMICKDWDHALETAKKLADLEAAYFGLGF